MGNLDPETGVRHPTYLKALIGPKLCDESPFFMALRGPPFGHVGSPFGTASTALQIDW